jgi:threonine-phosphate decarboxylase
MALSAHGGNVRDFSPRVSGGDRGLLDFSSNINPFGPPEDALTAARDAISPGIVDAYPDARQTDIRAAFSEWLDVPPDWLVFSNGASDLIRAAMAALRPSRLIISLPTFSEYAECAMSAGVPVVGIPSVASRGFAFDAALIEKNIAPGDLVVTCQPNNPTGVAWTEEEMSSLARVCAERGARILADECFINLAHPRPASFLGKLSSEEGKCVTVLRALTKDFSAPGLRVGFAAAMPETAEAMRRATQPWPLNCAGEAFAIACAKKPEPFLSGSALRIAGLREAMTERMRALGVVPNPAAANFILARSDAKSAGPLHESMIKRGILIRQCANFPTLDERYFRVAVKREDENERMLVALSSALNE